MFEREARISDYHYSIAPIVKRIYAEWIARLETADPETELSAIHRTDKAIRNSGKQIDRILGTFSGHSGEKAALEEKFRRVSQ